MVTDEMIVSSTAASLTDEEIVERVRAGEAALFEVLMRRYNQRLYRVARAILGDDSEAEDVMQEAYVRAYLHLDQFTGAARFSTWLTKIAVYEARARVRQRRRFIEIGDVTDHQNFTGSATTMAGRDPEQHVLERELQALLEAAIETLPPVYRSVFVLREVEGMSTAETAACLGLSEDAVKVRLHRARARLRKFLSDRLRTQTTQTFPFGGARCDRVVSRVFERIRTLGVLRKSSSNATSCRSPHVECPHEVPMR